MFGIGGGELIFILFVILMLFGSDKVPDIARTMGKAMAQLKNATNDIKSEIQKGAEDNGFDKKSLGDLTGNITSEIDSVKSSLTGSTNPFSGVSETLTSEVSQAKNILSDSTTSQVDQLQEEIEDAIGPIKRKM
ncbi:Sec-independent protein translocase subunit TatA/TatB [Flavobacterium eburneipallidum]|uniref:Sec-independent protein translocase subunit TatA/TatB n=1 Tax=Flavobacterium eburneipallidum TaxID=3003263 RepID=UPI0022AC0578|nr:twin-arginine translocase TatA/TatE family subunit [Flavobacterium eburneipallidum]